MIAVVVMIVTMVQAQMMPPVPADPAIRMGKLENGLTYYIRHNEHPEHVANFYIAQRVGSIQEEDSQRGLAHFLEHMAFNGSVNFKDNGIIEYTRSLGVAFGKDLNAYTSIEETVYNINNVPTARVAAQDSCLLILKDWSNGLLLLDEEIDKERGVVHGEWAMRNSAMQRLFEKNLPLLYAGNKYGERLPIGTMEVVDGFKYDELRAYYRKWYHPENQAIIVVGDVDVDRIEGIIKQYFSGIKASPDAAHVQKVAVEDNNEAIYVFDMDKEMPYSLVNIILKSDPLPDEMKGTVAEYMQSYMLSLVTSMFNNRMSEIALEPDCPFNNLSMGYGNFILSSTKEAFDITAVAKEGKEKECLQILVNEVKRAKEHGFTASEFFRAKEEFLSQAEKAYDNRDKRTSEELYKDMVENYLHHSAMPDAETEYQLWQMLAQQLPLDMINQVVKESLTIDEDKNFVCMILGQDKEGVSHPSIDEMKTIVSGARAAEVEAWVDNAKDEPLISEQIKDGKIVKETENAALGYTELVLSNGAKVILKKTDFKDNEIVFNGWTPGGKDQYGEADYSNLRLFEAAIESSGLGNFSNNELEKALTGKQASCTISLANQNAVISGKTTPKDVETMFQLAYLHMTNIQKDEKAYTSTMGMLETMLKNRDLQPETALSDTLVNELQAHNPRYANLTVEDLKNVSYDRILTMAKERFASAKDFTFTIIGNYDDAIIRPLICKYIASLPAKAKAPKQNEIRTFFKGEVTNDFTRKMETPKPMVVEVYNADGEYSLENDVLGDYVGEVLSMILLKSVREDAGAAYSISASCGQSITKAKTYNLMQIYAPISAPEKLDLAIELISKGVKELAEKADPDMVAKVKANLLKQADVDAKENSHWQSVIESYVMYGVDLQTRYKQVVEAVTPEMVSAYLKNNILKANNHLKVVMRPQE